MALKDENRLPELESLKVNESVLMNMNSCFFVLSSGSIA